MTPIKVTVCSRDASEICHLLKGNNSIHVIQSACQPDVLDVKNIEVLIADPDLAVQLVDISPNLKWMQSTWAGNAPLMLCTNRSYRLTVARGIFDKQIREYVFTYLLAHVRKTFDIKKQNSPDTWQHQLPNYLHGKNLGIFSTGSLAKALLPVAHAFGLNVIGVSRSGQAVAGFDAVYTLGDKTELARTADFVVNLLPDTAETKGCLDSTFFDAMKPGSLLINAGRGSAIDEQALLEALDNDKPGTAVLDVFNIEPLPAEHLFWSHPKVIVTQHTAAITQISDITELFTANVKRFIRGEALKHQFNWQLGY